MKAIFRMTALAILVACAAALPTAHAQSPDNYIVGPKDVLVITIYEQPTLSNRYPVEADGSFAFPHLGAVKAAGLTVKQIETDLRERLSKTLFRNPQVAVGIETYRSQRIFIMGEVRTSGQQSLTGAMTLIEAIASAGGITPAASGDAIIVRPKSGNVAAPIMPGQDATAEVIDVNLAALQAGDMSQNKRLRDGDTVYIPRAETIYVFGEVRSPGAYAIQKDTTVIQALSLAGGQTPNAALNRIKIHRMENGKKVEIKVKNPLTEIVKPRDTIVVPERWF